MRWFLCAWDALSRDALYGLLQLRAQVFVVEQTCAYQDLDDRDAEAVHLWAEDERGVAACARILPGPVIGRVVTRADLRGTGLGFELMERALRVCPVGEAAVHLSAQAHLEGFYRTFGFVVSGPGYLEDGIPHLPMDAAGSPRERGLERMRAAEARFLQEVPQAIPGEGWGWRETREHLMRVSDFFRTQIASQTATWEVADKAAHSADDRALSLLAALRSSRRFAAPDAVHPVGEADATLPWTNLHEVLEGLPEAADDRLLIRHPFAGLLTVPDALNFLAAHCDHHRKALLRRAVPCAP